MSSVNNFRSTIINGKLTVKNLYDFYDELDNPAVGATLVSAGNLDVTASGAGAINCNYLYISNPPTCSIVPTNSNELCNKQYVDSRTNVTPSSLGGYFTITGECSDISSVKMYNWSFGGNRQGSSALAMDVALGCSCSLQYIYVSITGPITVATTFQLLKNGSATSSYNLTLPVSAVAQTKTIDLSGTPILFNRGDRFRWKTIAGTMVLDAVNNAGRMTMTFASSVYYSQDFVDFQNQYYSFRDVTLPDTYATWDGFANLSMTVSSLTNHVNDYTDSNVADLQYDVNNFNTTLSNLSTTVTQNATTAQTNLNTYKTSNDTKVNDISYNLSLISSGSSGVSSDFSSYKTTNDAKVNDISSNLSTLKTNHLDLSSNFYSYKLDNNTNISSLQSKTAGMTYSSTNKTTTFTRDIECRDVIFTGKLYNTGYQNFVDIVNTKLAFIRFVDAGYETNVSLGVNVAPLIDDGYRFKVGGASQFHGLVDISNSFLKFTQSLNESRNGIEWWKTNSIVNSSIKDNGSLKLESKTQLLVSIDGTTKLDISSNIAFKTDTYFTNINVNGTITNTDLQSATQKLTNVNYTTGSGHKFSTPISINTDAISGYQLVVNGKSQLQGQVDISNGMLVFNQSANGINWKNNNVVNTSMIDDGTNCHLDTKNKFYVDINGVSIFDTSTSGITLNKNLYLPTGTNGQIVWGQSYSKIYDNGDLHIQTDDRMYLDIGTSNIIKLSTDDVSIYKPTTITGNITASNHYINNINTGTEGFAMSNQDVFSNSATNKIRIFNNNSSSYFDFASSADSKLHWRYGGSTPTEFLTFDGSNKRVGINKTDPAYALDVNGDINISNLTSKLLFNSGASSIYDNLQLHIQTDDNMYFDIGTTNIIYVNSGSVNINKNINSNGSIILPVSQSISWGTNYSKIVDDGDFHIITDDNMYLDIGTTNIIHITSDKIKLNKTLDISDSPITIGNYMVPVVRKRCVFSNNTENWWGGDGYYYYTYDGDIKTYSVKYGITNVKMMLNEQGNRIGILKIFFPSIGRTDYIVNLMGSQDGIGGQYSGFTFTVYNKTDTSFYVSCTGTPPVTFQNTNANGYIDIQVLY